MVAAIKSFKGEYAFLSNFYPFKVELDGITYPSVENAYQAAKTLGDREGFLYASAGEAKQMGRIVDIRDDWESVKMEVMLKLLVQKFTNTPLAVQLECTRNAILIEGNTWGDTFWGICKGQGQNVLGKMLMSIRKRNRAMMPPWEVDNKGVF